MGNNEQAKDVEIASAPCQVVSYGGGDGRASFAGGLGVIKAPMAMMLRPGDTEVDLGLSFDAPVVLAQPASWYARGLKLRSRGHAFLAGQPVRVVIVNVTQSPISLDQDEAAALFVPVASFAVARR